VRSAPDPAFNSSPTLLSEPVFTIEPVATPTVRVTSMLRQDGLADVVSSSGSLQATCFDKNDAL
jgi:hypothetical protein